jgi:hypothetical protein
LRSAKAKWFAKRWRRLEYRFNLRPSVSSGGKI